MAALIGDGRDGQDSINWAKSVSFSRTLGMILGIPMFLDCAKSLSVGRLVMVSVSAKSFQQSALSRQLYLERFACWFNRYLTGVRYDRSVCGVVSQASD